MYYVAMARGFLCVTEEGRYWMTRDLRWATPFPSFIAADTAAKCAARVLHRQLGEHDYYGILRPATGEER